MKKINYIIISALFAILPYTSRLKAQTIAVKSDLLTGALSSPNLSAEVKLSERFTLEAGLHYNPFSIGKDKYLKHWFVQPELRYWMYQPYKRSFLGINLMYGVYNISKIKLPFGIFKGIRSSRYEGDFVGIGISYGYHFILSSHWRVETNIGMGFLHTGYERYYCSSCGEKTGAGNRNFIAPTKAAISLVYIIK